MPMNSASDVSAAASSTTALTIELSHLVERKANIVPFLFRSQRPPATQGKFHQWMGERFFSVYVKLTANLDVGVNLLLSGSV